MKLAVFLTLAVFAFSSAQAALQDDLNELTKLVPTTKIGAIAAKHFLLDKEFREFKKFLESPQFSSAWSKLIADKDFRAAIEYSQTSGYDVIGALNELAKMLKVEEYQREIMYKDIIMPRTVSSFIDEVYATLPKAKMTAVMQEKLVTSPEFKHFHEVLSSPKLKDLTAAATNSPNLSDVISLFQSKGLHLDHVIGYCRDFLSWVQ